MALPTEDLEWVTALSKRHDAEMAELEMLNRYYEGTQPLTYMHPEIFREVQDRIKPVIIAWPQLVVDAIDERLDVRGFRLPDEEGEDKDLWRVWQANDMDEQSGMAHIDALGMKRAYVSAGSNEDDEDTPILAAESPLEMFADIDPRTRKERAALRRVIDDASFAREAERSATLYVPSKTVWFDFRDGKWVEVDRDEHNLGVVPVVSLINRARLSSARTATSRSRYGRSELSSVIPISDGANKIATDMMVAAEGVALPLRGLFGISPEDLQDKDGNTLTAVQALMRKLLTIPVGTESGVKEFEFAGASLGGFHESINSLARIVASLAGLPPDYMGLSTDNPPSAESRLAGEIRLIKRAERKQSSWGGAYEQMCRLVRRFQEGGWDPKLRQLETRWRDASTPTVAQSADAAVKKYTAPPGQKPIATLRQTREDLGYTDPQIRRMEREDEAEERRRAQLDPLGEIARGMAGGEPPGVSGRP
jgi:hypothetical protein